MDVLSNQELQNVNGGGKTLLVIIGGLALFAVGVFCGIFDK